MGLKKDIISSNGVPLNYHRVSGLYIHTNNQNVIEIQSYTSQDKRKEEMEAVPLGRPHDVYKEGKYYDVPYDQNMTISNAYEYLKTLPEFENAKDI